MTDTEKKAEEFKAAVRKQAGRGPRNKYTAELRAQAVEYGRTRGGEGVSVELAAKELGLSAKALRKWSKTASGTSPAFRRVEVVPEKTVRARGASPLVLHGPGGLRVEGLDVESLAALLRRLG